MKKLLCAILVFIMTATLCAPVTAVETESTFVPETFTREELLAMDPELDSDGDGLVDVIELVYDLMQAPFMSYALPSYLDVPRDALVAYATSAWGSAIKYPHYVESYYILATELEG